MQSLARISLIALICVALASGSTPAQGPKAEKPESEKQVTPPSPQDAKPEPRPYLLTIAVKESSSGKLVLDKNYVLSVIADDNRFRRQTLRDGDRIPYRTEKDWQYEDVGTNVDASDPTRRGESLAVNLVVNSSALVASPNSSPGSLPQVISWSVNAVAVLPPGKPTMVYSATDTTSGHKVEIQATAQPLAAR